MLDAQRPRPPHAVYHESAPPPVRFRWSGSGWDEDVGEACYGVRHIGRRPHAYKWPLRHGRTSDGC